LLKKLFGLLVVAAIAGLSVYWYATNELKSYLTQSVTMDESQLVTVTSGTSGTALLRRFESQGWIEPNPASRLVNRLHPELLNIKAGTFYVEQGLTLTELLNTLVNGKQHQYSITFIEGSTFKQWREQLAATDTLVQKTTELSEAELAKELGIEHEKLEGLFLAETFYYTVGMSDLDIYKRAHRDLTRALDKHWQERDEKLPLKSAYEALILASIIEKETAIDEERGLVSSVFINRLNRPMRLQTDPTVIYGMGDSYKGNIRKKDLQTPTPYNTYTINGLPPTPIAMVGEASIEASLHPESSNYLYFVATGKGGHKFSTNLKDHNAAVREYLKQLRANR
jgi:UPF0755 protein